MQYLPNPSLFPQPALTPEAHQVLQSYSKLLSDVRNMGTHVIEWYQQAIAKKSSSVIDAYAPVLMSFRHVLEVTDGAVVLFESDAVEPIKLLARSLYESGLTIEYISEENVERRGMAFMTCHVLERMKELKLLISGTKERENFLKSLEKDELLQGLDIPDSEGARHQVARFETMLKRDNYSAVVEEYERTRKKLNRWPSWYSLYDGPTSVKDLADALKRSALYHFYYRRYSGYVHGSDILVGKLVKDDSGKGAAIVQLRAPDSAHELVQFFTNITLHTFLCVLEKYAPQKKVEYGQWYREEIKPKVMSLSRVIVS